MNIVIKSIPHKSHRYSSCGDWFEQGGTLFILVSDEMPEESKQLVALHEFSEWMMCKANGVTQKQVDDFDMGYEEYRKEGDDSEPGDHKDAPYHDQHRMATAIELVASNQMKVDWLQHEAAINKLFE